MNKGIKISLITISLVIITIVVTIFGIQKFQVFNANKIARENIVIGDNKEIEKDEIRINDDIGKLTIPDILLSSALIKEGIELDILDNNIGHFPSTSIYTGNIGIASHNSGDTGTFFKDLYKIKKGSEIYYECEYGTRRYIVETIEVIEDTDWSYLENTGDNRITLITCINGEDTKRLCVQAVESEENLVNNQ